MEARWVIGQYHGARAQSVKAHADAGIGYYVRQESGAGHNLTVQAAFRVVEDGEPIPEGLDYATPDQVFKLEKLRKVRSGLFRKEEQNKTVLINDVARRQLEARNITLDNTSQS